MKVSTYRQLYQMEIFIGSSFDFSYLHRDIMFLVFFCPLFVFFFFVQGCNFFFIFVGPHFDFSLSYRDIFSNFISPLLSIGSQRGQCLMSSPPGHSSVLSYHIMSLSPPPRPPPPPMLPFGMEGCRGGEDIGHRPLQELMPRHTSMNFSIVWPSSPHHGTPW
jgi:hypothetical protein